MGFLSGFLIVGWYVLKYTLPIIMVFVGFSMGGSCADSCSGDMKDDYIYEKQQEFTHIVTICWDEYGNDTTELYVREDLNWNLLGCDTQDDLYYVTNYGENSNFLPSKAEKSGKVFLGLFDTPFGGNQYVSARGYSLKNITEDVTLYAVWEDA